MRFSSSSMCILILALVLPGYGAEPSVSLGIPPLADLIHGLKASALDTTALRQLGGTGGSGSTRRTRY